MTRLPVAAWRVALALLGAGLAVGADAPPRTDQVGDPLPTEAVARMGSGRLRHDGGIRGLAFAPDGKSLVSGGQGGLQVWDTPSGQLRRRVPLEGDAGIAFTFTADGVAVARALANAGPVTVQVFDAAGKVRRRVEMPGRTIMSLTFSPDGRRLALSRDHAVSLYDTATGREAVRIPIPARFAKDVAFAPDGRSLAVCDARDTVRIYDTAAGKELRALQHAGDESYRARFSPDGRWLVSIPYPDVKEQPGACSVWDVAAGKERHRLRPPFGFVLCAAFSPDGKYLATGGMQRELVLWDVAAGKKVRRFPVAGYSNYVTFSPDGKSLAAGTNTGVIRLWDVVTGRALPGSADPAIDAVHDLRFSADGRRLLGCAAMPIAWQPLTGREVRRFPAPAPFRRCWLSPDETLTADVAGGDVRLSDARTGKELRVLKAPEKEDVSGVVFVPGGRLASGGDGAIRVWDTASGRQLHRLPGPAVFLAASPDGRRLASADYRPGPGGAHEVVLWDLGTGREQARLPVEWEVGAGHLTFSPDGRLLAAGRTGPGGPVAVKVWDAATGKEWRSLAGPERGATGLAFAPDGRALAVGGYDGSLTLWELASGRRRHVFAGHKTAVGPVAFSAEGRLLAASSSEAPVFVWDATGAHGPKRATPTAEELWRCWDELAGEDAEAAFRAIRRLAGAPAAAVPFLRERLKPAAALPPERLRRLLAELDGADFAARRRAAAELEQAADAVAPELRRALEKAASAEVRRVLRKALDGLDTPTPARLRFIRAVEALEWVGTPEAARLLDELARGAAGATLTAEAAAARERLRKWADQRKEAER